MPGALDKDELWRKAKAYTNTICTYGKASMSRVCMHACACSSINNMVRYAACLPSTSLELGCMMRRHEHVN